ncbi:MAG: hypothetical protein U9N43_04385 [Euryarchaeota archaeon]|nr:hypothetical protein [Euryarchaeota archaeon]
MNKQILARVALMDCMFVVRAVFAVSTTPADAETKTTDIRGEVVDAAF